MSKDDPNNQRGFFSRIAGIAAYPVAAAVTYFATETNVDEAAKKAARASGGLDKVDADYVKAQKAHTTHRMESGLELAEYKKEMKGATEAYEKALRSQMKELGLSNFPQKWERIDKASKQAAMITGVKAGAIALGAMLAVSKHHDILHLLSMNGNEEERSR